MTTRAMDPAISPFGARRLPAMQELVRRAGNHAPRRWLASLARRISLIGVSDPIDVDVFGDHKARLHPRDNRCEKRVFSGAKFWDLMERETLGQAAAKAGDKGFVFVDAGSNVGLYTLSVRAAARRAGVAFRGLAIEPDPVNGARLRFNLGASGADDVTLAPVALANQPGVVRFITAGLANRGEARVDAAEGDVEVVARPLLSVVEEAGLDRIDAMKMDIEGREIPVLEKFFTEAPRALWPRLIVIETGRDGGAPLLALLARFCYRMDQRVGLNCILSLTESASTERSHVEA